MTENALINGPSAYAPFGRLNTLSQAWCGVTRRSAGVSETPNEQTEDEIHIGLGTPGHGTVYRSKLKRYQPHRIVRGREVGENDRGTR